LAFVSGVRPSLWTAAVVIVAGVFHRSGRIVPDSSKHASKMILFTYLLSLVSLVIGFMIVFRHFGWRVALAGPVIFLIYISSKEDDSRKWERGLTAARVALFTEIAKSRSGSITQSQLRQRSQAILARLPRQAYFIKSLRKPLLSGASINPEDHKSYLELLERHIVENPFLAPPDLSGEVRLLLKK
jgi:hypothetical protein